MTICITECFNTNIKVHLFTTNNLCEFHNKLTQFKNNNLYLIHVIPTYG